jgi:ATP-dependent Clp protease adaptor protein ClpS
MSTETETVTNEKTSVQIDIPSLYRVIFLNDDTTPMEHVIDLLITIFNHDHESATNVTLEIHNTGAGIAGIYAFEIAEQKALEATESSKNNNYPLRIRVERDE